MSGFMNVAVPQQAYPAIIRGRDLEIAAAQAHGAALDVLCKVFSACMPIFAQAMQSLTKGSPLGPDLFR